MKFATLVLQDGTVIEGQAFGAETDAVFELVFNTSMTGYQEILTDPSYRGQGVLFTVSHIGNVGINLEDDESAKPQVSAAVIRSLSPVVSNWRSALSLSDWLDSTWRAWYQRRGHTLADSQTARWRHAKSSAFHKRNIMQMSCCKWRVSGLDSMDATW